MKSKFASVSARNGFLTRLGGLATATLIGSTLVGCGGSKTASTATSDEDASMCANVHIGTQDQVINTAVGGAVVRELKIFEKNLPKDGKYKGLNYNIESVSYTHLTLPTNREV